MTLSSSVNVTATPRPRPRHVPQRVPARNPITLPASEPLRVPQFRPSFAAEPVRSSYDFRIRQAERWREREWEPTPVRPPTLGEVALVGGGLAVIACIALVPFTGGKSLIPLFFAPAVVS